MIAYYIHWNFPTTADDSLYYGEDDKKLFHKKENAQKYMEESLKSYSEMNKRAEILEGKKRHGTITKEEKIELQELLCNLGEYLYCIPCSGTVCKREIIFGDYL